MIRFTFKILWPGLMLLFFGLSFGQGIDLSHQGQVAVSVGGSAKGTGEQIYGTLRYLPEGAARYDLSAETFAELRGSLNIQATALDGNLQNSWKLYRLHFRLAGTRSELRIGLQKINFGPARLLRMEQWFDWLDPRDPLGLTSGVYGLRYTYGFDNNASVWLWSLIGNDAAKGLEIYPSVSNRPEWGGRVQVPIPAGESALAIHSREARFGTDIFRQNRVALDARFDTGIGWWFETQLQQNRTSKQVYPWQRGLTLGADYTFALGNGLQVMAEHMFLGNSRSAFSSTQNVNISAGLISYPIGIFDQVQGIVYYAWPTHDLFQYYNWQRTYDAFTLNLSLFHYPGDLGLGNSLPLSGYGAQLLFILNY